MNKEKVATTIIVLATLILAGIAVFTALRLYERGSQPVSPAAPASQPSALSGWPECNLGQNSYNKDTCRQRAVEYKGVAGPNSNSDSDWYRWATSEPRPLSGDTSCGIAPTMCAEGESCSALIFTLTDGEPSPSPSETPEEPTNTPTSSPTATPSPTNTPTSAPTATPTRQIGGETSPTPTNTPQQTATPTEGDIASNPSTTPTTQITEPTPTDTRIAQANSPTPTSSGGVGGTGEELPPAGNMSPTILVGLASMLLIILGLALAF